MIAVPEGPEILGSEACLELLAKHWPKVGRVGFADYDHPVILPVNYAFHDGAIVFRTASGAKLLSSSERATVAFEIDETDPRWQEGWSVLVVGAAEEILDPAELEQVRALPLRPWATGMRDHYVRIRPRQLTGRRIT